MINLVKYADAVGEVNLEGAALGSINEMKMGQGVTDFDYQEEETTLNNIPGIIQRGTMMNKGIKIHFINIAYGMGLNLWQVMVAYQEGDEIGRIASERVVKSIKINDHATSRR